MTPETRAAFCAFTDRFEGDCPYLYTDIVGLVTCARGNLVDAGYRRHAASDPQGPSSPAAAMALGWEQPLGSLATAEQIRTAWLAVKAAWPAVQSTACARLTTIRLPPAAVDALTFEVLDVMWAATVRRFPQAETWPACAQLGILSMDWAMGDAFEGGFPRFDRAAEAEDWAGCAVECLMTRPPVPRARNAANVKLFEGALRGLTIAQALAPPTAVA
jgi:hypothetical protein